LESLKKHLSNGVSIKSSGTTGPPKDIFRTPQNLKQCNRVAVDSQKITKNSRIYTVCKMDHAGGMLAQTLPAISVGAEVVIDDFNAKRFIKEIHKYTHTHLTPRQAKIIMNTKHFTKMNLSNIYEALDVVDMDINEGADIVMIKPGTAYLDVVHAIKSKFQLPTFVYQVSGEYSMLALSIEKGWLDKNVMLESLVCCKRAGADAILTYAAKQIASELNT
jgi:acyl-CoA synthetase (AMP-forming)/AMP-acid ligase II